MEYLQQFKNYLFSLKPVPSKVTVKNYVLDVKHFIVWFTSVYSAFDPKLITLSHIEEFKKQQRAHLSARSLERHISSLRKFFQAMKLQGSVAASVFEEIKQADKKIIDPYHLREFKDFLYVYNASNLTIKNYIIDVKQFLSWAESLLAQDPHLAAENKSVLAMASNELIAQYRDTLASEKTFSPSSINRKLSSLRKYFTWAKSQNVLENQTDYQLNPNAVENIPGTSSRLSPREEIASQQLASLQETSPVFGENSVKNVEPSASESAVYSSFPPFRLVQKISKGFSYVLELAFIAPLAAGFIAASKLVWTMRGKPIFTKIPGATIPHSVKNISKWTYNPLGISTKTFPWYKKVVFHARYTRPNWYKKYHSYAISHYFNWAILMIVMTALGFGFYNSFVQKPNDSQKLLAAAQPNRILSFQGRLTDTNNNAITSSTNLRFGIYTDATSTGSALLWQEVDTITPDSNGVFSVLLGKGSPMQQALFANNANLFLGIAVGQTAELTPRQQLATVAYATNAETLQGLPPITQAGAGTNNVVLALNSAGNLSIGAASTFQTVGGAFTLAGDTLVLNTNAGTNGNITLAPDGQGFIDLQKPLINSTNNNNILSAQGSVEVDDTFAILATNSGVAAETINQNGSADLFTASSSGITRFTIGNAGAITDSNYTTGGGIFYANANGLFLQTTAGSLGQCLTSAGGGTPTWGGCGGTGSNFWTLDSNNGILYPINTNLDVLFGGTSSSSANFAFINNAPGSGTPTASISGNLTLNSAGKIQTTNNQGLIIGGPTTGNITLSPLNGNGSVTIAGLGTGVVQANGGLLSTGNVNLTNEVTGILPLSNGGTGANITGSQGGLVYFNTSTTLGTVAAAGTSGLCLLSGGTGTPTWANCSTASSNWWNVNQGVLYPINNTFDLVLGSATGATTSAKFSVLNMTGSGTPTASVSSGLNGSGTYITANGTLQTTNDQGLTIGGASTGNITLTPQNGNGYITLNGNINSSLIPQTTDAFNLGSSTNEWNTLFVKNIISGGSYSGFWQRFLGVLSPINNTDDLAIGGTATATAKFQIFGNSGNATTAGSLTFTNGGSQIQTTSNQTLTLGGPTTGGITLSPNNGNGTVTVNGTGLQTTASIFNAFTSNATILGLGVTGGTTTVNSALTVTGNFTPNGQLAANLIPTSTAINLGSASNYFGNAYITNLIPSSSSQYQGFWQLNSGALSPFNITNDILVGGNATSTAKFQIFANSGNATTAGNLTFNGTGNLIQTTNNQGLIIGGNTTGNITLAPLNGNGSVTIAGLGTGVVQANGGLLSTGNVNLTNEVTGILPLTNGGTGANITGDQGGVVYFDTNTTLHTLAHSNTVGQCLTSGGTSAPSWSTCALGGGVNWWNMNSGVLYPINQTLDLVMGSATGATTSAKFAVLNMTGSGTPTASVSSGLNGTGLYMAANGTIQTTSDQGLTVGGPTTGNITLTPQNGNGYVTINGTINSNLIPTTTDTFNLGSATDEWNNLYVKNIISGGTISGFWQRLLGVLSPTNITDDLAIGGTATSTAKFQVFGLTGNATTAGNLTFTNGGSQIQTSSNQVLTLGGNSTGGITLSPNNGNGTVTINGSGLQTTASTFNAFTTIATNLNLGVTGGTTTVNSALTVTGTLTANGNTVLGASSSNTINPIGQFSGSLVPNSTSINLGSASNYFGNAYITNLYPSSTSQYQGFWQLNSGALSPTNITNDILVGGTATATAKFQIFANSGNATTAGNLTFTNGGSQIQTTSNQPLTLGGNSTGNIIVSPNNGSGLVTINGHFNSSLIPGTTDTYDLGTSGLEWNNLYVKNLISGGTISGFWQRLLGVVSPTNITDDLAIGGTATSTAKFQIFANSGNATTTGTLTFTNGGSQIQTTSNQPLTLGGTSTGGITLSPNNGNGTITLNGNVNQVGSDTFTTGTGLTTVGGNLTVNGNLVNLGNGSTTTVQTTSNAGLTLLSSGTGNITLGQNAGLGNVVIQPNAGGQAALEVIKNGPNGDIFTASAGATTRFTIQQDGTLVATKYNSAGGVFYTDTTGTFFQASSANTHTVLHGGAIPAFSAVDLTADVSNNLPLNHGGTNNSLTADAGGIVYSDASSLQILAHSSTVGNCLLSGGSSNPTWGNCTLGGGINWFNMNQGTLFPINNTLDLVMGSATGATTSAKFAVLNMTGSGTPTASVSSGLNGTGTFITANGTLQTTSNQGLTIGGISTGNITLSPLNGSGTVTNLGNETVNGNVILGSGNTNTITANGEFNTSLIPATTDTYNLGSSNLEWNNLYVKNIISGGSISGFWQRNLGALSPTNITDDILGGGTGTTSAKFAVLNMTGSGNPTASVSSGLNGNGMYFDSTGELQSVRNQGLTIGGNTTGNVTLAPLNGTSGSTINLNAGTLATNQTSVNLLNSTATTINFGGAATTLAVGAGASTTINLNATAIDSNQGTVTLFNTPTSLTLGGNTSVAFNLGKSGSTTTILGALSVNGNTTLGTSGTNTIAANGQFTTNLIPNTANTYDLGSTTLPWRNLYLSSAANYDGFWQQFSGVLSPTNITDDLAVGGTSTSSALFQVFGLTGNATTAGTLTFTGTGSQIQTVKNQPLTLGGNSTGNIILKPNNGSGAVSINGFFNTNLSPITTDTYDLGANNLEWNNLYVKNIISTGNLAGFWQRNNGTVAPLNITDDILAGGISTTSAKFAVLNMTGSGSPTASVSSGLNGTGLYVAANGVIQTTSNQGLTIGGNSTGNITLSPLNGIAGSSIALNAGNITTNQSTVNLLNSAATTINFGGAATTLAMGAGSGTTINLNATAIDSNQGTLSLFATPSNITFGGLATTLSIGNASGTTTVNNSLSVTGNVILGTNNTKTIAANGQFTTSLIPSTSGTNDLGSATLPWRNLYLAQTANYGGLWQQFNGAVIPNNITDDLLLGNTATTSAKFAVLNMTGSGTPTASVSSGLNGTGMYFDAGGNVQTVRDETLSLGGISTGNIAFKSNVASNILPYTTNTYDLGSSVLQWNNIYANNIFQNGVAVTQFWQRNLGVLSPLNITDDLAIGNSATGTAKFQIFGLTGNATTAGNLTFNGSGNLIQTTNNQGLTIGGNTTGTITLAPSNGSTGSILNLNTSNINTNQATVNLLNTTATTINFGGAATTLAIGAGSGTTINLNAATIDNNQATVGLFATPTSITMGANATTFNIANNSLATTIGIGGTSGTTTVNNNLSVTGNVILGTNNTKTIAANGQFTTSLIPSSAGANDLGTPLLTWRNLYLSSTANYDGFWQQFSGVLSPNNITDDLVIGSTASLSARFHAYGFGGTVPAASASAKTSYAAFVVNNDGVGDVLAASSSSVPVFSIQASGKIVANQYSNAGGVFYTNGSGVFAQAFNASANTLLHGGATPTFSAVDLAADVTGILPLTHGGTGANITGDQGGIVYFDSNTTLHTLNHAGSSGQCLISGGTSAPSWASCSTGTATNWWNMNQGALFPTNETLDLVMGSSTGATTSAKFAVLNMTGSGTPTASVSSGLNGTGTFITANGTLQTTSNQGLTIGGNSTGDITLAPLNSIVGSAVNLNASTIDDSLATATLFGTPTTVNFASSAAILRLGATTGISTFATPSIDDSANGVTLFTTPSTINFGNTTAGINLRGNVTLGTSGSNTINPIGQLSGSLIPQSTSINLGSPSNYYGTVYANNFVAPVGGGTSGFWTLSQNVLSPVNSWNDLAIGGNATGSATPFQVYATTVGVDTAGTATSSGGLSFRGANTNLDLLNGSTLNIKTSVGGDNGLGTVFSIANNGNITTSATNIATTQTSLTLFDTLNSLTLASSGTGGSITIGNTTGTTTIHGNVVLGDSSSNTLGIKGLIASNLLPDVNNNRDLGSTSDGWRNLFLSQAVTASNLYLPVTGGTDGYWSLNSNVLSPTNIWNDLAIGGTATGSATPFQVYAKSYTNDLGTVPAGTATSSGNITFRGSTSSQTTFGVNLLNNSNLAFYGSVGGDKGVNTSGPILYLTGSPLAVGIGKNNPQATLDVSGTGNFLNNVFMNQSNGGYWMNAFNVFNTGILTDASNNFIIRSGGTNRIISLAQTGFVGIGDTTAGDLGNAELTVNQTNTSGLGDIFTASAGGATKFTIANDGTIKNSLIPNLTDTYNLGSDPTAGGKEWNNLYVRQIITPSSGGIAGFWQLNSGILAPANLTNDLAIGGTSTSSALFQVFGNTGSASTSGNLSFTGINESAASSVNLLKNTSLGFYTSVGGDTGLATAPNPELFLANSAVNSIGIGTNSPLTQTGLDIEKNSLGNASLIINQKGLGDVFTASVSGTTKFVVNNNGNVGIGPSVVTPQGILDVASSGPTFPSDFTLNQVAANNLMGNPSFEKSGDTGNSITSWSFNHPPEFALSNPATESALFGDEALRMNSSRDSGSTFTATSACIPVLGSKTFTLSAFQNVNAGFVGNIGINFQTFTDRGCTTGQATAGRVNSTTTGSWTRVTSTVTTGATVAGIEAQWIADTSSHGIAYLDGIQLEQSSTATPYLDGSMGPGYYWDQTGVANATDSSRLVGSAFAYQTLNSASGIGAASRGTGPTLQLDQDGLGDIMTASASGITQFQLTSSGILRARSFQDLDSTNYFIDPASSGFAGAFNGNVDIGTSVNDSTTSAKLNVAGNLHAGTFDSTTWGQTAFNYRQKFTLTNSGSTISNYQYAFIVDTASLISAGKMQSSCQDLRVSDNDGTTLLSYWIESGCNTAETIVWIKIPSVTGSSSQNFYVYYGNSTAASQADITKVMNNNVFAMAWSSSATTLADIQGVGIGQTSGTATSYNNTQTNSNGVCYQNGSNTCANGNGNFDGYGQTAFSEKWIGFININATVAFCNDDGGNFRLNTTGNTNLNGANWTTGANTKSDWNFHTVTYNSAGTINTGGVYQRFEYEHFNGGANAYITALTSSANCNSPITAITNADFYSPTLVQTPPTLAVGTEQDKSQAGSLFYANTGLNNVGIGTANPDFKLEIRADGTGNYPTDNGNGQLVLSGATDPSKRLGFMIDTTNNYGVIQAAQNGIGTLPLLLNPNGGNVGIGITTPSTKLDVNAANNATLTTFTQSVSNNAIAISSTHTEPSYLPGLVWYTTDNNATKPKAGIWAQQTSTGSFIYLGTSNSYSTGITNQGITVDPSGNVGIGVTSPGQLLEVKGAGNGTGVINATDTGGSGVQQLISMTNTGGDGLGLGYDYTHSAWIFRTDTTGHNFLWTNTSTNTMRLTTAGQLITSGAMTPSSTPDIAEGIHVEDTSINAGDIISADDNATDSAQKTIQPYQSDTLGVVSTDPSILLATGNSIDSNASVDQIISNDRRPLVLAGRVPTKVTTTNGDIHNGDHITTSTFAGVGMKATQAGETTAVALQDFIPSQMSCTQVSSLNAIDWPQNDPWNNTPTCYKLPDGTYVGKIMAFVKVNWYDPDIYLTSVDGFNIAPSMNNGMQIPHYYTLTDVLGQPIQRVGAFGQAVIGMLKVGFIDAQEISTQSLALATDNMTIAGQSLRNYIISVVASAGYTNGNNINSPIASIGQLHTNLISPLASDSAIALDLQNSQFTIRNSATGTAVATIDNTGNATFSGTVNSQNLAVNGDATVSGTLHAGKIVAQDIEGLSAVVGTLSAQNITNVTNMYFATPSSQPSGENIALGQNGSSSSNSGLLNPSLGYTNLASYSGFLAYVPNLSADTAMFNQGLVSLGATSLGDTTVTGQLSVGTNLILADSSINVLGQSFEVQPLRQGGVNFEGGLIAIDTNGNLTVNGNAVFSKDLAVNIISPLSNDRNLTVKLGENPTASGAALATSQLSVQNASGSGIFSVDQLGNVIASGAAQIGKLNFNLVQPALAVSNTEVIATGSAGTAFIKPYETEVTVDDGLVTNKSLIYITPVGSSTTPYLLRQVDKTSFTVGLPTMTAQQVQFNFLIVN